MSSLVNHILQGHDIKAHPVSPTSRTARRSSNGGAEKRKTGSMFSTLPHAQDTRGATHCPTRNGERDAVELPAMHLVDQGSTMEPLVAHILNGYDVVTFRIWEAPKYGNGDPTTDGPTCGEVWISHGVGSLAQGNGRGSSIPQSPIRRDRADYYDPHEIQNGWGNGSGKCYIMTPTRWFVWNECS